MAAARGGRLRKIGLLVGGILVGLATAELLLWGVGALIYSGQHRASGGSGDDPFTIACIGDSWTQGAPTGRYPRFLVDALNEPDRAIRFDYANLGRAGTNSSQALRRLPGQIASHRPDLLLVLTGNNDHHNLARSTYWRFQDASLTDGSIAAARFRVFLHSLRLLRLARTAWATVGGAPTPNEFFEDEPTAKKLPARVAIDPATHRRQLEYNLTRLVELARKERIPIVFQTYFHFHGYRVNEIVRDVASTHGVPLVDHNLIFHTRLTAEGRESLRIPDGHPNPAGYAMMATSIVELLEAEGIVPIAASRSREP